MNGACLKESLVYYATTSFNDSNYKTELYQGNCETSFKMCFSSYLNHVAYHCTNTIPSYQQNIGT